MEVMATPMLPPESTRLGEGRYALVSKIGEGGMAVVYRALDRKLRVWRAIKVLQPRATQLPEIRERFEREAQTMALLEHPHLVRVYDVGQLDDLPFLVMELVEGGTLDQWVERNGRMPARMAVDAARQVARALAAVHSFDVVHRDVKPNNVLVTPAGVCKLTDFGIARTDADSADPKLRMGTRGYMAPEQRAAPATVDARADLYGLGATLWRMLRAEHPQDLFLADTQPLLLRGIPPRLHPILTRCLAHRKERRFASASAAAAALDDVLDQLPEIPAGVPPLAQPLENLELPVGSASTFDTDSGALPIPSELSTPDLRSREGVSDIGTGPIGIGRRATATPPPASTPGPSHAGGDPSWVARSRTPGAPIRQVVIGSLEDAEVSPRRRPPAEAPAAGPHGWMVALVVVPIVVSLLIMGTVVVGVAMGKARLGAAEAEVGRTATVLASVLDDQRTLIDELGLMGAEREMVERRYLALIDARGERARMTAAIDLVQSFEVLLGNNVDLRARNVDAYQMAERLRKLRSARREYDAAVHEWRDSSDTIAGQVVLGIGLADPPP
jgi:serine/threonine protein kinase